MGSLLHPQVFLLTSQLSPCRLSGYCDGGAFRRTKGVCVPKWRWHALSNSRTQEYSGAGLVGKKESPVQRPEETSLLEVRGLELWHRIDEVKAMLGSIGDGEISSSAYDTAWVALIRDSNGDGGPQFPSCIRWIVGNQLLDGSWGDAIFSAHDRMINTLGCVIALKSWGLHPEICDKGIKFICKNIWRLAEEEEEFMPIGFEIAFPSLIEMAKDLGLELPYNDPALDDIYAKRDLKLKRIPKEVMHEVPTSLLHSLEGMPDLDWGRLLKLQCPDGSFLFSPSATAYSFMQTGDHKCLKYLQNIVKKFDGGVPNVYPVDLFEHLWVVDRLERLGISRYFESEIKSCLNYVYRYWTEEGICWARNSRVHDVDDTAMGFRLLRLHGYDVSPDVLRRFEKDGMFFCFIGQSNQAVTGMYNLNRASQVLFPGEEILERAKSFSYTFLRQKQACKQLRDKWIITKDLPGEVEYALEFPWYASLPRVETRIYIEHYGGGDDVWIGKTLYRMPLVNNELYLELAKADFNQLQSLHQLEWLSLHKWYEESGLISYGVSWRSVLRACFLATACIFEPDRAAERLGWVRTAVLADAISAYFRSKTCTTEMRRAFLRRFLDDADDDHVNCNNDRTRSGERRSRGLVEILRQLVDRLDSEAADMAAHGGAHMRRRHLRRSWEEWLLTWRKEEESGAHFCHGIESGREETGLLLIRTVEVCGQRYGSGELKMEDSEYSRLARLASSIFHRLQLRMKLTQGTIENQTITKKLDKEVESEMQALVHTILMHSTSLSSKTKQTFLNVVKSFYYLAHCPTATLNNHISKVIFERVV
ncbi:ent-copalyl diphosphate synthase 1-like isoform X1 [Typha angustifolia]|uniref:ent-copalyl diphosphate synthase 1-like isoform X1 n=1 Tax=Typha angustifolia TaxID=59011 RepID=UPI003C2FB66F